MLVFFLRLGLNLLEEGRIKLEIQPVYLKSKNSSELPISFGLLYIINNSLSLRTTYFFDTMNKDQKTVLQLYYYRRVLLN